MTQVYVGIGSNIDREFNVRGGITRIKSLYDNVVMSQVYECPAFGFEGKDFFNLVVGFTTDQSLSKVAEMLRQIEFEFGRRRTETKYASRSLDIDILLFDDVISKEYKLPREDILEYAFVLKPLAEIAPEYIHPEKNKTISELWQDHAEIQHSMKVIDFTFD